MGAFEDEKIYGIKIRESANDGSDFTNPDADYRLAFLGEDGLWHVKDSAGTVTEPFSSAADILDLPTAETDDTLVLAPDGAGGVEFRAEAGGGGGGAGSILGFTRYQPGSDTTPTSSSTSMVDIDAPNLAVAFTAPASGNVIVRLEALVNSPTGLAMMFGVREGTTDLGDATYVHNGGATFVVRVSVGIYISGISGGAHTYKFAWKMTGAGTGTMFYGPTYGPVLMTVIEMP